MNKKAALGLMIFGLLVGAAAQGSPRKPIKYLRPPECSEANYSCVLKVVDGEPFWCKKIAQDRFKSAAKPVRDYTMIKCIGRYPALVDPQSQPQPQAN
ncbi:MAG: hypothetical protein A2600_04780 [Candidatus Lambdaproteobacteria bacterium RIFOXYD1_FULL_56_27]|uniref:Uncharacterized protein n=1 Tax=Candidatus Lambdaproteobacteria bacterium RIFOXYD2_FULL_56_26 TaxID=1817773 RepID=A0A1F6H3W4_9PROT|nr:MAG: hypothetical protein A2426_13845 [Candidatus Lambdaproteobacteria bacterium RIFOXYC1_FULL_56_13]OGH05068.1 MAG: hypothetical protein A2557_08845 [Candidatus Lambdaproteobacteria bacterium RIFOXYD2_FULL_56_26]OGH09533.1 MAG: hypothetical protein A2600_04780 [Candidatus Lambdaproteobacteria bacterium RIFOXYD1_FULL_56_27]